jgi:hypothetical protein
MVLPDPTIVVPAEKLPDPTIVAFRGRVDDVETRQQD